MRSWLGFPTAVVAIFLGLLSYSHTVANNYRYDIASCVQRGSTWVKAFGVGLDESEAESLVRSVRFECLMEKRINPETWEPVHLLRRYGVSASIALWDWIESLFYGKRPEPVKLSPKAMKYLD